MGLYVCVVRQVVLSLMKVVGRLCMNRLMSVLLCLCETRRMMARVGSFVL